VPEAHPPAQMAPEARTRKTEPRSLACSGEASRMAVFKLTGVTDPLIGWTFPILGDAFTIGCDDDNDLVIAHASVSRHHAVIRVEGDACTVLDLHSPRGTFVNDVRVSARPLHAGDTLRLGDVALRFQAVDAPSASPRPAHLAEPALEGDPVTPAQPAPASEPPAQIPPPEPTTATRPVEPQTNTPVARTASPPSPVAEAIESEVARVDRELGRSGEDILGQCRRITCFAGPDKGKTVPILVKPVFVGSHSNSDFQIKLWDIPAHHARIAPGVGKCVLLTDLGGLPGVTVKGQRIRSDTAHTVTLNPGDTFEIGEAKFLFHL